MLKPSNEQLVDLAEGRLGAEAATALRAQIAANPTAQANLATIEQLIGLMRADTSIDAPEYVVARALRLMPPHAVAHQPTLLVRIVAVLRSDSRRQPLAAGLRSEPSNTRSLIYNAEEYELDLELVPRAGRWHVRGQIFGPELDGNVTIDGDAGEQNAPISNMGEFHLPPVATGRYTLLVQLGSREIVVHGLELGSSTTQR